MSEKDKIFIMYNSTIDQPWLLHRQEVNLHGYIDQGSMAKWLWPFITQTKTYTLSCVLQGQLILFPREKLTDNLEFLKVYFQLFLRLTLSSFH